MHVQKNLESSTLSLTNEQNSFKSQEYDHFTSSRLVLQSKSVISQLGANKNRHRTHWRTGQAQVKKKFIHSRLADQLVADHSQGQVTDYTALFNWFGSLDQWSIIQSKHYRHRAHKCLRYVHVQGRKYSFKLCNPSSGRAH